jgi:hypothetical protein
MMSFRAAMPSMYHYHLAARLQRDVFGTRVRQR